MCALQFIYDTAVTLALKLHERRGVITRTTRGFWQEHFTTPFVSHITVTQQIIKEVKKGIDTGRYLKLPSDLTFSSEHMADLLVSERFVRPFQEIQ